MQYWVRENNMLSVMGRLLFCDYIDNLCLFFCCVQEDTARPGGAPGQAGQRPAGGAPAAART
uniref:Uncharacterized protein n=1 Tax=Cannabis sativa TaxID=3483 RepID=A0A803R769_CANSA